MPIYLNAAVMLAATLAGFVLLVKLFHAIRSRGIEMPAPRLFGRAGLSRAAAAPARLSIEQACMVDGKRRLLLVRCDEQRVLLLTGGPADLVVSVLPAAPAPDAAA